MTTSKRNFDLASSTWDEKPQRIQLALSVFDAMSKNIRFTKDMDLLDFGCGTGLLSLNLLPLVKSVTGADSSQGMLDILNSKISAQKLEGIKTVFIDLENGDTIPGMYDVITCSMAMHHIKDTAAFLEKFQRVLKPGGYLAIADLDSEDGMFHDNNEGVFHNGFSRLDMKNIFLKAGFSSVSDFTAAEVSKTHSDDNTKSYSVFLITGKKV